MTDDLNSIYIVHINQLHLKPSLPSVSKQSISFLHPVFTCVLRTWSELVARSVEALLASRPIQTCSNLGLNVGFSHKSKKPGFKNATDPNHAVKE